MSPSPSPPPALRSAFSVNHELKKQKISETKAGINEVESLDILHFQKVHDYRLDSVKFSRLMISLGSVCNEKNFVLIIYHQV
uniref:Uncharacterized protein n=1 Tax=Lactuca sativa TaxID=4236 RepID=A0A9R1VDD3_LACSA|nr:hypothetical protein LSAT_V11C500298140 [Lactuca sativa]